MGNQLAQIIQGIAQFYSILLIIYILMSWFPVRGALFDVYRVLGSLADPYLNIFRRFIPPMGGLDLSPILAFLVLQIVVNSVLVPLAHRL